MDWIAKLERKYGRFCINGLMKYLVIGCAFVFAASLIGVTQSIVELLTLDRALILKGQLWRLISFVFIPETFSPIFIFFELYLIYMFGTAIEKVWGSFRLNVYYAIGMISAIIAAAISGYGSALFLNLSIFLAFAYMYPNYQLLIFFVIPVKVKYLALFELIMIVYSLLFSPLYIKLAAIISFANFIVFFGKGIYNMRILPKTKTFLKKRKNKKIKLKILKKSYPMIQRCRECNRTSEEYPGLRFGYCIKCGSDHEYCQDHLSNHTHLN